MDTVTQEPKDIGGRLLASQQWFRGLVRLVFAAGNPDDLHAGAMKWNRIHARASAALGRTAPAMEDRVPR